MVCSTHAVTSGECEVLNASCDLQAAKDRSAQLQQQLAQRGTDLREAKEQLANLQKVFASKCEEVTADKQEKAALQKAHHATLKASIHCAETCSIPTCSQTPPPPSPPCSFPHLNFLAAVELSQHVLWWLTVASVASHIQSIASQTLQHDFPSKIALLSMLL